MTVYRFTFDPQVPLTEAEMSLHLAIIAVEGIYGQAQVRLDARYRLDAPNAAIVVDATTPVGEALVRVFTTLITKEFGEDAFCVCRATGDFTAAFAGEVTR